MCTIFGFLLSQARTLPDALGYGNCQTRKNTFAEFTMLNLNIAELIPDQGNMLRKQDAGGLMAEIQDGLILMGPIADT